MQQERQILMISLRLWLLLAEEVQVMEEELIRFLMISATTYGRGSSYGRGSHGEKIFIKSVVIVDR